MLFASYDHVSSCSVQKACLTSGLPASPMGIETPQIVELPSEPDPPSDESIRPSYSRDSNAFFANSHDFVISGGHFTNIIHQKAYIPANFREIPAGDLILKELRLDHCGSVVTFHQVQSAVVRRMYSAVIFGSSSPMAVAVYDGNNAKESWTKAISKYSRLRHPNVLQLFGTTKSAGYYMAIFHDDLVSAHKLLQERSKFALWTFYFQWFLRAGFRDAASYISSALGGQWVNSEDCTLWIRASTGKICLELTPGYQVLSPRYSVERHVYQHEDIFDESLKLEVADLIASSSFRKYCSAFYEDPPTATLSELPASVSLGSILDLGPSDTGPNAVIARLPVRPARGWRYQHWYPNSRSENGEPDWTWNELLSYSLVDDQWACIKSDSVTNMYYYNADVEQDGLHSWLTQANRIFNELNLNYRRGRFAVVLRISIKLTLEGSVAGLPPGFLFLYCPSPLHPSPAKPRNSRSIAYWALDRTGCQHLSAQDAASLGFPEIKAEIGVHVKSWDSETYAILRQLHEGKAFGEEGSKHLPSLAPVPLAVPPTLSVTPLKTVQSPSIEKTLSKVGAWQDLHAGARKVSATCPQCRAFMLLQCGFIVASASFTAFVLLLGVNLFV